MMDDDAIMQTPEAAFSFLSPMCYSKSTDCGYCRGRRGGFAYYARTHSMSADFYQTLIDRCWRRSGSLLYRPNQRDACCPHYTLRLDSDAFKSTRDQRQTINRFNRYVLGEDYIKEAARRYPRSREDIKRRDTHFDLVERVHEAEKDKVKTPPVPAHNFTVSLDTDEFTEEKYAVFENYQRVVHQEAPSKISRAGFKRFLCDSPIRRETILDDNGRERKLGSYHQCYYLDGKLVAIGVLDLLPYAVSAVYFLYDESIHKHAPGKLGALREIALAKEEGYKFWYSGYYVHDCPKMRYKMDYSPQYVLDPEKLQWDLLDSQALVLFDRQRYVSLSRERGLADERTEDEHTVTRTVTHTATDTEDLQENDRAGSQASEEEEEDEFLLSSTMPGIISLEEVRRLDLDRIPVRLSTGIFLTEDLSTWDSDTVTDHGSLKSRVGELVAALGPDLMSRICLDLRRKAYS